MNRARLSPLEVLATLALLLVAAVPLAARQALEQDPLSTAVREGQARAIASAQLQLACYAETRRAAAQDGAFHWERWDEGDSVVVTVRWQEEGEVRALVLRGEGPCAPTD